MSYDCTMLENRNFWNWFVLANPSNLNQYDKHNSLVLYIHGMTLAQLEVFFHWINLFYCQKRRGSSNLSNLDIYVVAAMANINTKYLLQARLYFVRLFYIFFSCRRFAILWIISYWLCFRIAIWFIKDILIWPAFHQQFRPRIIQTNWFVHLQP